MKSKKPFKYFLPLFGFHIVVIFLFASNNLVPDEIRYLGYADNLINGFYANPETLELWNGPGYPLILVPFVFFNAPYIIIQLFNAVFLLFAALFLFKSLSVYIDPKQALIFSYLFGVYPPMLRYMIYIYTEPFSIFLISGLMYYIIKLNRQISNNYWNIIIPALFLGMLALTRVTFGYVILVASIFYFLLFIFRKSKKLKNTTLVLVGAFMLCVPYLIYTYSLTGQVLYWGNQGGAMLYWRSTPFENEYGDWINPNIARGKVEVHPYFDTSEMYNNHGKFIDSVESSSISAVVKDKMYKEKALENIKRYPVKYLKNTVNSALRLFFEYPLSYKSQNINIYYYLLSNFLLVILLLFSVYIAIRNFRKIPFVIRFIGLITFIYIGGIILASGRVRYLLPIIPLLIFIIGFFLKRYTKFEIQ